MCKLLQEIEQCRKEMIRLSISRGLTSDDVVKTSQRLDDLLNEYQRKLVS